MTPRNLETPNARGNPRHVERYVEVGPTTRVVAQLVASPTRGFPDLDLRLARRSPFDPAGTAFCPTVAGFRIPIRLIGHLIRELTFLQAQAAELVAEPPSEVSPDA